MDQSREIRAEDGSVYEGRGRAADETSGRVGRQRQGNLGPAGEGAGSKKSIHSGQVPTDGQEEDWLTTQSRRMV